MQTVLNTQAQGASASDGVAANFVDGKPSELFTTLLVAQIRNQNPLEPSDPSEFVGQLTQLSQMEALQKLVANGNASASMLESMQLLSLGAQVGSQVAVRSGGVVLGAAPVEGSFTLQSGSSRVTLVLQTAGGPEHRIELGTRTAGEVAFTIDPVAAGLPAGSYALRIETESKESPQVAIHGALRSVKVSATGGVLLDVAGVGTTTPDTITAFNGRKA